MKSIRQKLRRKSQKSDFAQKRLFTNGCGIKTPPNGGRTSPYIGGGLFRILKILLLATGDLRPPRPPKVHTIDIFIYITIVVGFYEGNEVFSIKDVFVNT